MQTWLLHLQVASFATYIIRNCTAAYTKGGDGKGRGEPYRQCFSSTSNPVCVCVFQDAVAQNSFHEFPFPPHGCRISRGDAAAAFRSCDHVVGGEIRIGGQEHFYMETHVVRVVPTGEDGELVVHSGLQHLTKVQVSRTGLTVLLLTTHGCAKTIF